MRQRKAMGEAFDNPCRSVRPSENPVSQDARTRRGLPMCPLNGGYVVAQLQLDGTTRKINREAILAEEMGPDQDLRTEGEGRFQDVHLPIKREVDQVEILLHALPTSEDGGDPSE